MLMLKSKEMREQRAKLISDSRTLLDGGLTAETRTKVEALDKEIDQVNKDIELYEKQEQRERELATTTKDPITPGNNSSETEARKAAIEAESRAYTEAFTAWARGGENALNPEQRSVLKKGFRKIEAEQGESRAQTITTTGGGYTIPQGFQAELERAQLFYGGVRQAARILATEGGNVIPWPTIDDTGNSGEDSTINVAASAQDMVFGQVQLNAYKMDSGLILLPNELLEDTGIKLEQELPSLLGERLGRRQNVKYTTGTGASTFQGVVTAATVALTTASPTAIAADELITFQHKVDPAYRNLPSCKWMMNDDTIRMIRQLKDSSGRYLLDYSTIPGVFTTLLGKEVVTNQQMATVAATTISVLFGAFEKFIVRDVRQIVVRRLAELYAVADQVGFIAFYRGDSRLVSASTKALCSMQQHA